VEFRIDVTRIKINTKRSFLQHSDFPWLHTIVDLNANEDRKSRKLLITLRTN